MGHGRKLFYSALCWLVFFLVMLPAAGAQTDSITTCIEKYTQMGKSYEDAKMLCAANDLTSLQTTTQSQSLPDLIVQEMYCAPGNKLGFNIANVLTPMPSGWTAVAYVYFDGVKKGSVDLGRPTGGDLTTGSANYLTAFEIINSTEVKIIVDPMNNVKETDERNNVRIAKVSCDTSTASGTPVDPIADCTKKYKQVFNIPYEEARKLCTAGQVPADVTSILNRCGELERKLAILIEELNTADGQEVERFIMNIKELKAELRTCQAKAPVGGQVVTPGIKNPCDEVKMLKESLLQLEKKMIYIKESISRGEMNESDLAPYSREYHYLKERLEKVNFACQQGKPLIESPCARLSRLEMIYKEMNDKSQGANDDKTTAYLKEKLDSVGSEIEQLKQKCRSEELNMENVESLYDIEKAYRAKQKAVVEGTLDKDLHTELEKVELEKKKLLEEFIQKLAELDARHITIIKKLQIKDGQMIMDDMKMKASKVKLDIDDRDIEIESTDKETAIIDGSIQAQGNVPLEYANGALTSGKSGKEIKVMPSDLLRSIEGHDYVEIDDEVTWLPITIIFQATELSPQPDPPGVTLPVGTRAEKIKAGHYRFILPDGQIVEIKDYDKKTGIGDVSISDQESAAVTTNMKGSLSSSPKPRKSVASIAPSLLKELKFRDDGTPEYLAKVDKKGKLLGIIPLMIAHEYRISAENGEVIEMDSPWWSAIAIIDPDPPS